MAAGLLAVPDALCVEGTSDNFVADTGEVLHPAAADQHDRVLLQVVPHAGDKAVTSMPEVKRTRATLRSAEFGFFGVVV